MEQKKKKQPFRFRIPWISGAPARRPAAESLPRRPKSSAQPDTSVTVSIQRSPFRPAPSPTHPQGAPITNSKPQQQSPTSESPSRSTTETSLPSPLPSSSSSPSRPTQIPGSSLSPSIPSSPISKTQPHSQTNEVSKPTADESTRPASSASQQEKEKMAVPEPGSKESERKIKSPLKIIPNSQKHTPPDTSSQPENMSTQHTGMLSNKDGSATTSTTTALKTQPTTKKLELDTNVGNSKIHSEAQSKFHQSEEKGKAVQESIKVRKAEDPLTGQQIRQTKAEVHAKASASGTQTEHPLNRAFRGDKKQQEGRETVERKMMFAASNPSGKDILVVSSTDPVAVTSNVSPQKPVLPNREKAPQQKGIREDISNFVQKLATGHPTQPMDDKAVSVITLAGDNRGAAMHIGSNSAKKEGSIPINRAYRNNPEESPEVTTDGEESSGKESNNSMKMDEDGNAYVNSNIQSINNSLMLQSSINERDPGVQLILPQKPAEPTKSDDKRGVEARKAELNVIRTNRLTYQPTVRRRCLRGLFLEPSDSDPDNPDKPRRHGCKFNCGNLKKGENDMEIL